MIKLIVFDLDGVLVDARELHYEALNKALADIDEKYVVNRSEHLSSYDGLSTSKKLSMLTETRDTFASARRFAISLSRKYPFVVR